MASGESRTCLDGDAGGIAVVIEVGLWEPCFAWRPTTLYMTGKLAWLRPIFRRAIAKNGLAACEYTDDPEAYPRPSGSGGSDAIRSPA